MQKQTQRQIIQSITDKLRSELTVKAKQPQKSKKSKKAKGSRGSANKRTSVIPAASSIAMRTRLSFSSGSTKYPGSLRVKGCELLEPLAAASGSLGELLLDQPISPSSFHGTRLEQFSHIFEKYLFRNITFMYVPAVGTTNNGAILLAYDRDINDELNNGDGALNLRQASSYLDAIQTPIWQKVNMPCKLASPEEGFYTKGGQNDPDARLSFQGRLNVLNSTGFTGETGSIWIDYDLELFVPAIEREVDEANLELYYTNLKSSGQNPWIPGSEMLTQLQNSADYQKNVGGDNTYEVIAAPWDVSQIAVKIPGGVPTAIECIDYAVQAGLNGSVTSLWPVTSAFIPRFLDYNGKDITATLEANANLIPGGSSNLQQVYRQVSNTNSVPSWETCSWFLENLTDTFMQINVNPDLPWSIAFPSAASVTYPLSLALFSTAKFNFINI